MASIDHDAITRVFGERATRDLLDTMEIHEGDLANGPALVAMAIELERSTGMYPGDALREVCARIS